MELYAVLASDGDYTDTLHFSDITNGSIKLFSSREDAETYRKVKSCPGMVDPVNEKQYIVHGPIYVDDSVYDGDCLAPVYYSRFSIGTDEIFEVGNSIEDSIYINYNMDAMCMKDKKRTGRFIYGTGGWIAGWVKFPIKHKKEYIKDVCIKLIKEYIDSGKIEWRDTEGVVISRRHIKNTENGFYIDKYRKYRYTYLYNMYFDIEMDRDIDPKRHFIAPGGYIITNKGLECMRILDFIDILGYPDENNKRLIHFTLRTVDDDFSSSEDDFDLNYLDSWDFKEFFVYTGEKGTDNEINPVKITGLSFEDKEGKIYEAP